MMKKPPYSGCPQELYNLYSVDHFFFVTTFYVTRITMGR